MPGPDPRQEFTRLLVAWGAGDRSALDQLLPTIYDELRKLARSQLGRERPGTHSRPLRSFMRHF